MNETSQSSYPKQEKMASKSLGELKQERDMARDPEMKDWAEWKK